MTAIVQCIPVGFGIETKSIGISGFHQLIGITGRINEANAYGFVV